MLIPDPRWTYAWNRPRSTTHARPPKASLTGMLRLGRKGIPVGCVNGGCGVCKVRVLDGSTRLGRRQPCPRQRRRRSAGLTLACREAPLTAVRLAVLGKFEKPFSRASAFAGAQSDTKPQ
uniref:Chloroplast-type ferredoxin n=1 Tax=Ralstonia pickettii TaxID=329 RepID=Q45344_RALPI|nr:chloroplast-type ferredoxin [Ralstonia pickettii]